MSEGFFLMNKARWIIIPRSRTIWIEEDPLATQLCRYRELSSDSGERGKQIPDSLPLHVLNPLVIIYQRDIRIVFRSLRVNITSLRIVALRVRVKVRLL